MKPAINCLEMYFHLMKELNIVPIYKFHVPLHFVSILLLAEIFIVIIFSPATWRRNEYFYTGFYLLSDGGSSDRW